MPTTVSTQPPASLNPTRQQLDELEALLKRMLELPVNPLAETEESEDEDEPAAPEAQDQATEAEPATPSVSYMVIETASPRPIPPASGYEQRPSLLAPRLVPVAAPPESPVEEELAPIEPTVAFEPAAATEPEASLAETPAADPASEDEVWVPLRSTWKPSEQTWQPLAESWQQANGAAPAPAAMPPEMPTLKLDLIPLTPPAPASIGAVEHPATPEEPAARPSASAAEEVPMPTAAAPMQPRLSLSAEDAPVSVSPVLLPLVWFNQGFDACLTPLGAAGGWVCGPRGRQLMGTVGLLGLAAAAAIIVSAGMGWSW
jgi:hypothetical protein